MTGAKRARFFVLLDMKSRPGPSERGSEIDFPYESASRVLEISAGHRRD